MKLGTQELGHGRFEKHLVARKHKKDARKRTLLAALALTAMVDMFSVLVVFLLQSFSTSPEILVVTKGVMLPEAASGDVIQDAPVLSLNVNEVYLDQKIIGKTNDILLDPSPLMNKLSDLRDQWQASHPDEVFKGEISLQADRDLPSTIVSQFMAMVPSQAYSTIQLAVVAGGGN